ncbi:MAG: hypothetical protein AAF432_14820 [Planctomycetota bacterium]
MKRRFELTMTGNASRLSLLSLMTSLVILTSHTSAQCLNGIVDFFTVDGSDQPPLAADGDTMVVGTLGPSVRVYHRSASTWTLDTTLVVPTNAIALDLRGDRLVVSGSATYVIERTTNGWSDPIQLDPPEGVIQGDVVWIDDSHIAVSRGTIQGVVRIFAERAGEWLLIQTIEAPPSDLTFHSFGDALAAANGRLAVGDFFGNRVATYTLNGDLFELEQELLLDLEIERFGRTIAMDGTTLAIATSDTLKDGTIRGHATTYRLDGTTWRHEQDVPLADTRFLGLPRTDIDMADNLIVVGGHLTEGTVGGDLHANAHFVRRYGDGSWRVTRVITESSTNFDVHLASSLGITGEDILLTQSAQSSTGETLNELRHYRGVAFVDCNENLQPDSCDLIDCPDLDANADGILDSCLSNATYRVGGGDWFDPTGWASGIVPDASTDVVILFPVTVSSGEAAEASSVIVGCDGALTVLNGAVLQTGGLTVTGSGELSGAGLITGNVTIDGQFSPTGITVDGDVTLMPNARFAAGSSASEPDLVVNGQLTLGGAITVPHDSSSREFTIASATSFEGAFSGARLPQLPSDLRWIDDINDGTFRFVLDAVTPAPACLAQYNSDPLDTLIDAHDGWAIIFPHVYQRVGNEWVERGILDGNFNQQIQDVAIDEPYIALRLHGVRTGEVLVFRRDGDTWPLEQSIESVSELQSGRLSMALSGDTLAFTELPFDSGSTERVQVYRRQAEHWTHEVTLTPEATVESIDFGFDVALDGDRLVVSAPAIFADSPSRLYVYDRTGLAWPLSAILMRPATSDDASFAFGDEVEVSGSTVIASSIRIDPSGETTAARNATEVFRMIGNSWFYDGVLIDDGSVVTVVVPRSRIDVDGDVIASGTLGAVDHEGSNAGGRVFVYRRDGARWVRDIVPLAGVSCTALFGSGVTVDGDWVIASSVGEPTNGGIFFHNNILEPSATETCNEPIIAIDPFVTCGPACPEDCAPLYHTFKSLPSIATGVNGWGNGSITIDDVVAVITLFGDESVRCDVDSTGTVDADDLMAVISALIDGGCPQNE